MAINPDLLDYLENEGLVTLSEAAKLLRTSRGKLLELVNAGALTVSTSPLDRRLKLVRREEVEALRRIEPVKPPSKKRK